DGSEYSRALSFENRAAPRRPRSPVGRRTRPEGCGCPRDDGHDRRGARRCGAPEPLMTRWCEGLEGACELGDRLEAPLASVLEAARDDRDEARRHIRPKGRYERRGLLEDERAELRESLGQEGHSAREHFEEHYAERPDVGPHVDVLGASD